MFFIGLFPSHVRGFRLTTCDESEGGHGVVLKSCCFQRDQGCFVLDSLFQRFGMVVKRGLECDPDTQEFHQAKRLANLWVKITVCNTWIRVLLGHVMSQSRTIIRKRFILLWHQSWNLRVPMFWVNMSVFCFVWFPYLKLHKHGLAGRWFFVSYSIRA